MSQHNTQPSRSQRLIVAQLTAFTSCAALGVIFIAFVIGMLIDNALGQRGPATLCLVIVSIPITLYLMVKIALWLVRRVQPTTNESITEQEE